jgi:hypothetical protein
MQTATPKRAIQVGNKKPLTTARFSCPAGPAARRAFAFEDAAGIAACCISISGLSIDAAISNEVLRVLKPLGIEAALKAIEAQSSTTTAAERQLELSLQQARHEAAHARRQYDAVDPKNRLVAGELERRWNEALQAVARVEGEIAALIARRPPPLGEPERQQLMALGADLERAWLHPAATAGTRKRILRAALTEIVVRRDDAIIHAVLHWQGGDHTQLQVRQRLNAAGRHNPRIPDSRSRWCVSWHD